MKVFKNFNKEIWQKFITPFFSQISTVLLHTFKLLSYKDVYYTFINFYCYFLTLMNYEFMQENIWIIFKCAKKKEKHHNFI